MTELERRFNSQKAKILKAMRRENADFYFSLIRNKAMEELRGELILRPDFKGKEAEKIKREKVVNVLSFPHPEGFPSPVKGKEYLGEIYLNLDFVPEGKGKMKKGQGKFDILGPLFIHGFLHLLGYHHDGKRDTIKMKNLEKKLWALILSSDSTLERLPSRPHSLKSRVIA